MEPVLLMITSLPTIVELITASVLVVAGVYNVLNRTYITYILTNPLTGQVYIGRTSGFSEALQIVKRRLYNHKYYKNGFTEFEIDRAAHGLRAKFAIRGREQQLIDYYGGIGHPKVANKRRGVARANISGRFYYNVSNEFFEKLTAYSGIFKSK